MIAWHKAWEWEKLRRAVFDPEWLELTHSDWLRSAKKGYRELKANGTGRERVIVAVEEPAAWRRERQRLVHGRLFHAQPLDRSQAAHAG